MTVISQVELFSIRFQAPSLRSTPSTLSSYRLPFFFYCLSGTIIADFTTCEIRKRIPPLSSEDQLHLKNSFWLSSFYVTSPLAEELRSSSTEHRLLDSFPSPRRAAPVGLNRSSLFAIVPEKSMESYYIMGYRVFFIWNVTTPKIDLRDEQIPLFRLKYWYGISFRWILFSEENETNCEIAWSSAGAVTEDFYYVKRGTV